MCGINGIFGLESIENPKGVIQSMNAKLAHRGPDNDGIYTDPYVALGHRRLSIIDTSDASNQPYYSTDGNLVFIFNGEVYNFEELREEIGSDYNFSTSSDTEVVLAAYGKWGLDFLSKLNGMFSLAIWDKTKKQLIIARDRLGIKPLYYSETDDSFIFSSELRSLLESGLIKKKLDRNNLVEYLRYQTVHSPRTLIENVHSIPAGHYLVLNDNERILNKYWEISEPKSFGNLKDETQVKTKIKSLLKSSVNYRMKSDVPYGAFLSGGIDSSAIVGLMSEDNDMPVSTFSVVFNEREFSEAPYAEIIAKKFKTNHHEILLTADDFLKEIPNALKSMDFPSGDGPNTYLVSKVTKASGITMALSGLGGDELFAGYPIFKRSMQLSQNMWLKSFAGVFRNAAGSMLKALKSSVASYKMADVLGQKYIDLPHSYSVNRKVLFDKEINSLLTYSEKMVNPLLSHCKALDISADKNALEVISKVSIMEITTYMQNTLLRDSDQMSMAHALEVRVPFLDHRLVEYALLLDDKMKYPLTPKRLLVESLGDLLPDEIVNRPKMGFTFPWESWIKGELKEYCEAHLINLGKRDSFNSQGVSSLWNRFLTGDNLISWSRVWHLIVLENWLEANGIDS